MGSGRKRSTVYDKICQFTTVPESVIKRTAEIGSDAVMMFVYLRFRTNSDRGQAWPSYDLMQSDLGWGRSKVSGALKSLQDAGLLIKTRRFGQSTLYRLVPPPPDVAAPEHQDASSPETELLERNPPDQSSQIGTPVVPESDSSSPGIELQNQIESNQTQSNQIERDPARPFFGRARTATDDLKTCLVQHFSETAKLNIPPYETKAQAKAMGKLWWTPLLSIAGLVENDQERAKDLIFEAVRRMRRDKITIATPKSILKVAISIVGERETDPWDSQKSKEFFA